MLVAFLLTKNQATGLILSDTIVTVVYYGTVSNVLRHIQAGFFLFHIFLVGIAVTITIYNGLV